MPTKETQLLNIASLSEDHLALSHTDNNSKVKKESNFSNGILNIIATTTGIGLIGAALGSLYSGFIGSSILNFSPTIIIPIAGLVAGLIFSTISNLKELKSNGKISKNVMLQAKRAIMISSAISIVAASSVFLCKTLPLAVKFKTFVKNSIIGSLFIACIIRDQSYIHNITEANDSLRELKRNNFKNIQDIEDLKIKNNKSIQDIKELNVELNKAKLEKSEFLERIERLKSENTILNKSNKDLELYKVEPEKYELIETVEKLKMEITKLNIVNQHLKKARSKQIVERENEIKLLNQKIDQMNSEVESTQNSVEKSTQ